MLRQIRESRSRISSPDPAGFETDTYDFVDAYWNLKANTIDRAFICDVYHHFEYPESSLKSIYRAMRTGGKLILVDFHREPDVSRERKQWLQGHIRAPLETFKQEMIDAGFKFEEQVAIVGFSENYLLRFSK